MSQLAPPDQHEPRAVTETSNPPATFGLVSTCFAYAVLVGGTATGAVLNFAPELADPSAMAFWAGVTLATVAGVAGIVLSLAGLVQAQGTRRTGRRRSVVGLAGAVVIVTLMPVLFSVAMWVVLLPRLGG